MSLILVIEIDNNSIKIMEASKKGKSLTVLKCFSLTAASGIEEGKIIDTDSVASLVKEKLIKNSVKARKAVFVINSGCVITRKIRLPLLNKKDEILSMIRNELEQIIPADLSRYKIIYKIVDETCRNDVKDAFYVIYCLPEDIYYGCRELARKLKLRLDYIDVSFNCLNKISIHDITINGNSLNSNGIYAFVNINSQFISFCVLNKGINDFSRIFSYNEKDDLIGGTAESQDSYSSKSYYSTFFMNELLDEISKYIRYFYSIDNSNYINKLYIYGDYSNDEKMIKFLSDNLKIEVEVINQVSDIQSDNKGSNENLCPDKSLILILSLFNDKKDICFSTDNFIECRYGSKFCSAVVSIVLIIVSSVIAAVSYYNIVFINKTDTMRIYVDNVDNARRNSEIENLKKDISLLDNYLEQAVNLKKFINQDDYVSSTIFREVFRAIPQNTRVTSISVDRISTQLSCFSASMEDAALLLHNLREIDFIEEIYLPVIEVRQEGDGRYSYSIVCKLKDVGSFDN